MTREEEIYNQLVELFSAVDKQPKNFKVVFSKRQLNIAKEAEKRYLSSLLHQYYSTEDLAKAFRDGAEWADMHPVNVWHEASEEPQEYPILCKDEFSNTWLEYSLNDYIDGWVEYVEFHELIQWAYISDLLPKGSTKRIER